MIYPQYEAEILSWSVHWSDPQILAFTTLAKGQDHAQVTSANFAFAKIWQASSHCLRDGPSYFEYLFEKGYKLCIRLHLYIASPFGTPIKHTIPRKPRHPCILQLRSTAP